MRSAALLLATLSIGACGHIQPANPAPQPAAISEENYRAPDDVLRDPAKRFELMNQLARQIYGKTRTIDDARYQNLVRPSLLAQLRAAGFSAEDAEAVLNRSDIHHPTIAKNPGGGAPSRAP